MTTQVELNYDVTVDVPEGVDFQAVNATIAEVLPQAIILPDGTTLPVKWTAVAL